MCALVVTERGHDVVVDAVEDAFEFGEAALAIVGGVIGIATAHRTGDLAVGDLAIVVEVSCAHRAEAFHACHEPIDELAAAVIGTAAILRHARKKNKG
jgi:molybdopterin synthase catalytic subunit